VVGDNVEHEAHPPHPQLLDQRREIGLIAELGIQARRVNDVVAVGAAAAGLEQRRAVEMGDAEPRQIRHQLADPRERKPRVELQAVGGQDGHVAHDLSAGPRGAAG
jgi:hypothetical protein